MASKEQFVKDLKVKDDVHSIFLVKYISIMEGRDGRSYLNLILTDNSGELETRKWQGAQETISQVKVGNYVFAKGKVNQYQGRVQFIASEVRPVDESEIELNDFIVASSEGPEQMLNELLEIVENLTDVYIKDLVKAILFDPEINKRLRTWQAGKTIHHAYQSGLLEHALSCTNLGVSLSKHYKVNENFVIAGCIMHDLCKVFELTEGPAVEYTDEGKLLGHLVKSLELIDRFAEKMPNFPRDTRMHLKHVMAAHHGEYEFGSPKIPQTSEAYLVHLIDLMDSKMNTMETVKRTDPNIGRWTNYIKHLDRVVYKDELPHYSDYLPGKNSGANNLEQREKPHAATVSMGLKQSMADKLKDFKV